MNSFRYIRVAVIVVLAVAVGWLGGRRWERMREPQPADRGVIELSSEPPDVGFDEDALLSRSVSLAEDERDTIRIYEERNRAVVNINTETVAYNWFLEPIPQEGTSGS